MPRHTHIGGYMNELKGIRARISNEWKGKIRFSNLEDETRYIEVTLEKGVGSIANADRWGDLYLEQLTGKKQPIPAELFEHALEITTEQLIELYKYWGSTKVILVKNTAIRLNISNREASIIKDLAFKYNLITQGHNSTWKVVDPIIQGRWIAEAIKLERGERPLNYDMPKTPQESLDRLERMSTSEQKAKARGEAYIKKDIEEEEVPTEVIHEQLYSPAKEAKEKEKKARDEQAKRDSEEYKRKANSKEAQPVVPKCIRVLGVIEEKEKDKPKKQKK